MSASNQGQMNQNQGQMQHQVRFVICYKSEFQLFALGQSEPRSAESKPGTCPTKSVSDNTPSASPNGYWSVLYYSKQIYILDLDPD